jgi:hypothetical protein
MMVYDFGIFKKLKLMVLEKFKKSHNTGQESHVCIILG